MRITSILISMLVLVGGTDAFAQESWTELGGSATGGGIGSAMSSVNSHAVAVDRQGRAVVAWIDSLHLYLRRWNGSEWEELGGSGTGAGISGGIATEYLGLALDSNDNPCLAYVAMFAPPIQNSEVYFRRWDGNSWIELGGSATGGGISQTSRWSIHPALALDAAGNPCVAWAEYLSGGIYEIHLRRWTGSQWDQVGGSASGSGISGMDATSYLPKVALTASGNPVVGWKYDPGSVTLGTVNFANQQLCLRAWNGSVWQSLGDSGSESGVSASPWGSGTGWGLGVDGSGHPLMTWMQLDSEDIHFRRWDGSAWVAPGGSASGGGVSQSDYPCGEPSLALDGAGNPVIAWNQWSSIDAAEICVRRWTGATWESVGDSVSISGISNSIGNSAYPKIAISPLGAVVVAWHEGPNDGADVWVKRFDNAPDLQQRTTEEVEIPIGEDVIGSYIKGVASFTVTPNPLVRIEVEARPAGVLFTGLSTVFGAPIGTALEAQALLGPLIAGPWHWRARLIMPGGEISEWFSYGSNSELATDFKTMGVAAPSGGPGVSENDHDTGCGLTGLEAALVVAGLFAWARRRRRAA